jgi:hypothetical protein
VSENITVTYSFPPPPRGWEFDRVRQAEDESEMYFNGINWIRWTINGVKSSGTYPVAVRSKWRPAKEADVGREDARFFDHPEHPYCTGKLLHIGSGNFVAISDGKSGELFKRDHASNWKYCEVPVELDK